MGRSEMNGLVEPHGGVLVERRLAGEGAREALARSREWPAIPVDARVASDIELLACGALSPLRGFMGEGDYRSVVERGRLAGGLPWTIPIVLPLSRELARGLRCGQEALLKGDRGLKASLKVEEIFERDGPAEARGVYRTTDERHPGVRRLHEDGEILVGGEVLAIEEPSTASFSDHRLPPAETRRIFRERGWRRVAAFQTRNPIHRAHEYIQKCALEITDGLLLHPLVGPTKDDDIAPEVRVASYERLLSLYYPPDRVLLGVFPGSMRYAGPREAIFHAIVRKNYGCTHFIVGRDHAGVGNYYGPFDAHRIFDDYAPEDLGITPLFFDNTFFCLSCNGMASPKTCPHPAESRVSLSGTRLRELLREGRLPPPEITRPEVAEILIAAIRNGPEYQI